MASPQALLIHGGRGGDAIFDDVHVLALDEFCWSGAIASPVARVGHATALIGGGGGGGGEGGGGCLLFFGGFNGSTFCNNTWHAADGGKELVKLGSTGEQPQKRFAHACAVLGSTLFVFGGSAKAGEVADLCVADASAVLGASAVAIS